MTTPDVHEIMPSNASHGAAMPKPAIGTRWRQTDGYLCVVVGLSENGWPWVRHPNAKQGGHIVNPAWFSEWARVA